MCLCTAPHAGKALQVFADSCMTLGDNAALQGLDAARCLGDLRAAHTAYLHAVRRLRLSEPERDWHVIASAITAVLNAVLQFCALVRSSRREREVRRRCCRVYPHYSADLTTVVAACSIGVKAMLGNGLVLS